MTMRQHLAPTLLLPALLCFGSVPAAAEPISLNYRVNVFEKLDMTTTLTDWRPIAPITFTLSVRFDGNVTTQRVSEQSGERYAYTYFGAPHLSNVPLEGAGFSGGTHT